MSAIISLSCGAARADLFLQYGKGTENPSAMIINHSGEAQIEIADIQRFADDEIEVKVAALAPETKRRNAEAQKL